MATTTFNQPRPGSRLLGLKTNDPIKIARIVQSGFPVIQLNKFQKSTALPWDKVSDIIAIPARTLARRQHEGKLHSDESDRLWRAAAIFDLATDLFEGDSQAGKNWLLTPQPALGGAIPLELASTDIGGRQVEQLIAQLEHGIFP